MNINTTNEDDKLILSLSGRLDANTALKLKRILNSSIDNGQANILIDCEKLDEISSAGIDFLLLNHKKFFDFNGSLTLCNTSYELVKIFENLNVPSIIYESQKQPIEKKQTPSKITKIDDVTYQIFSIDKKEKFSLEGFGNPDNFAMHTFSNKSSFLLPYNENSIGLGLGTLSYNIPDGFNTFGEYINIGAYTFHLPSTLNSLPDYQKINSDIVANNSCKVNTLYGLRVQDSSFNNFVKFSAENSSCTMSNLIKVCMNFLNSKAFYFVAFTQLDSFSGIKLIKSPLLNKNENAFEEKHFMEKFKYMSDERYKNNIGVCVGFVVSDADLMIQRFLKPYDSKLSLYTHIHSLVFNYQFLDISYNTKINSIIDSLVMHNRALDLCHLVKDENKNYETSFLKGFCYFNSLDEFKTGEC